MTTHKLAKWLLAQADMPCAVAWDSSVRYTMDAVTVVDATVECDGLTVGGAKCMLFGEAVGIQDKTAFVMNVEDVR